MHNTKDKEWPQTAGKIIILAILKYNNLTMRQKSDKGHKSDLFHHLHLGNCVLFESILLTKMFPLPLADFWFCSSKNIIFKI